MPHLLRKSISNIIILGFLSALFIIYGLDKLPMAVLFLYSGMSALAFILYGWDKVAAMKGWRRIRERTLHMVALLSGWPGAAVAQQIFRHKTKKAKFRRLYWLTALINIACFYWVYSQQGAVWFKTMKNTVLQLNWY